MTLTKQCEIRGEGTETTELEGSLKSQNLPCVAA